jgi:hypothetical protein
MRWFPGEFGDIIQIISEVFRHLDLKNTISVSVLAASAVVGAPCRLKRISATLYKPVSSRKSVTWTTVPSRCCFIGKPLPAKTL